MEIYSTENNGITNGYDECIIKHEQTNIKRP